MNIEQAAPAKINLTLEALRKRSDGYHDILSVIQTVDLCDTLTFSPAADVELTCNLPELASPDNLVARAALSLRAAVGYEGGAAIHLEKRIPVAAGLGGGSSDAAATLKGLSRLWGVNHFPLDRLTAICTRLGMDVPYFLYGGAAMVEGRGDVVTPLRPLRPAHFVLLYPSMQVAGKTAKMYGSLSAASHTSGEVTRRLANVIGQGGRLDDSLLFNVFESVAGGVFAGFDSLRQAFAECAGRPVHLTGAGPTLFCLADDERDAERLRGRLVSLGLTAFSCRSLGST